MSYISEVLADLPAAYYAYAEASGLPQDSSGNSRHVTAESGTAKQYQQVGPITSDSTNYAINFSGDDWFSSPDSGFDFADVFTLEVWLKRAAASGVTESFFFKGANGFQFIFHTDNVVKAVKSGVQIISTSTPAITDTNWHHLVWTKSTTTNFIYIDGADATGSVTNAAISDTTVPMYLSTQGASAEFFSGLMARPALYPTALSGARVLAHYNAATATAGDQPSPRRMMLVGLG